MAETWLALLKGIRTTKRNLAAGEALFRAGEPVTALFRVESGLVRLNRNGAPVHNAGPATLLGESGLFEEHSSCDAVALAPSRVAAYAKTAVLLHLKAHPDLALAFAACLARGLDQTRARLELARLRSARERVLAFLRQNGPAIVLDRPLTVMAGEIGLTHEALYRTLAKLERDRIIRRDGRRSFTLLSAP